MQDAHDLAVIIAAQVPLIVVESHDEKGALELLQRVAREQEKALFRWSITDGLNASHFGLQLEQEARLSAPEEMLNHLKTRGEPGIYVLCDIHPWLEDHPRNIRLIKDIAIRNEHGPMTMVLVSHALKLPRELARYSATFSLSLPNDAQIMSLVKDEARKWAASNNGRKVRADTATLAKLAASLKGLSHAEVRRLARKAIYNDGAITDGDIPEINRAKFRLMDMDGVLSFSHESDDFSSLAGMDNLKQWLELRRDTVLGIKEGMDPPKGLLLLGVQGGGKSLAAKSVAGLWGLPMLRLDMGALYNKYFGETERNLREALQLADQMAPCVLWVDEIEKGISTGDGADGGPSQRVLGTLLTWMQERTGTVFMVATANDISRLPPELLRKGRFDEIFFVDLPETAVREQILAIHLARRGFSPEDFDIPVLAEACEGFSGAEIEQAVVGACYSARDNPIDTGYLLEEISATAPLSQVMAEKLEELRQWAHQRNVRPV